MKHFLKFLDMSGEEILELLDLADELKKKQKAGEVYQPLKGKSVAMIFRKSSTRTRVSFEVGISQLGATPLFLSSADIQLGRGESIEDTARVLSRYVDGIMIRTFAQQEVEDLAKYGSVPVINGLTDFSHPCQVMADLQTIREHKGRLQGLKLAFIGDGNNMANALIVGGLKAGLSVCIACPKAYSPDPAVLEFAKNYPGKFALTEDIFEAAKDADVVYTDVWASMGQEEEREARAEAFKAYQINAALLTAAKPDVMVQHCLPAHKGEEISEDVFEAHALEIFDQAENRLHAQKAILVKLMA
ncbi:MAG: ornithine carbamoyltransferase [Christensenellaceae bacterium]|jgi:ornithine carbamoyltransferase|nr:ornithine carbamoyltransferase [Christensenellaceae bacterium]